MSALMIGTFVMVAGAVAGAVLFRACSESRPLIVGGLLFLFGAMWVGSGIQQLRSKDEGLRTRGRKTKNGSRMTNCLMLGHSSVLVRPSSTIEITMFELIFLGTSARRRRSSAACRRRC